MRIKYKIFLSSFFAIIGIIFLISAASYSWVRKELYNQMEENANKTLAEKKISIENIFHDVENVSRFLLANQRVQEILKKNSSAFTDADQKEINDMLASLSVYKNHIRSVTIISINDDYIDFKSGFPSAYNFKIIKGTPLYKKTLENSGMYEWFVMDDSFQSKSLENVIVLSRVLNNLDTLQPLGIVLIQLSPQFLAEELNKVKLMESEALYIVESKSKKIVNRSSGIYDEKVVRQLIDRLENQESIYQKDGKRLHVLGENISNTNLNIVSVVDFNEIARTLNYFKTIMKIIIGTAVILDLMLSSLISTYITRPIKVLEENMRKVEPDVLNGKISMDGKDEIANLSRTFDRMMERINRSIVEVYNEKLMRKESELNLLQAQINPHFLYNALDTINWMAIANDEEEISRMLIALSKIFRLSLSSGKKHATISNEIEHVKNYITIMEQRYPYFIDIQYAVDEKLLNQPCAKTILQPLVENAFVHGFKDKIETGKIYIRAESQNNTIILEVQNNGYPADLERIKEILDDQSPDRESFGIFNVHSRMKIMYGDEYGLDYNVNTQGDTIARIKFPMQKRG